MLRKKIQGCAPARKNKERPTMGVLLSRFCKVANPKAQGRAPNPATKNKLAGEIEAYLHKHHWRAPKAETVGALMDVIGRFVAESHNDKTKFERAKEEAVVDFAKTLDCQWEYQLIHRF